MCKDAKIGDLIVSRARWYDFPALLLAHRPVRCRACNCRYFICRRINRQNEADTKFQKIPNTYVSRLWKAYAVMGVVFFLGTAVLAPNQIERIPNSIASLWKQIDGNANL